MKHEPIKPARVMTATEFKAKCLEVMDRVNAGEWSQVVITKRGKDVAVLRAPGDALEEAWDPRSMYGSMKGSFVIDPSIDLTKPIYEQVFGTTVEADMGLEDGDGWFEDFKA
jgi:prevent-host-death family protein